MEEFSISVAIVMGLVELAKKTGFPTKFCPLLGLALGIGITIIQNATHLIWPEVIITGMIAGLTASGLFNLTEAPVNFAIKKVREASDINV